jgi:hypothetical protein
VPLAESRKRKLAVLDPFAIVTEVMFMPSVALRKPPVDELSLRFTVSEPDVTGTPADVWRRMVIVPVLTLTCVDCGAVVNTSCGCAVIVTCCVADE